MNDLEVVWNGAHQDCDRDLLDAALRVGPKRPPSGPGAPPSLGLEPDPYLAIRGGLSVAITRVIETVAHEHFVRQLYRGTETRFRDETSAVLSCGRCQRALLGSEIFRGARTQHGWLRLCVQCACERRRSVDHWSAALVAERKAAGLCVTCGVHPARPQRVACADCAIQQQRAKQRQAARRPGA